MLQSLRAITLGFLLTLVLGFLARGKPIEGPLHRPIDPPAALQKMKLGTAHQPFVRRQLVPFIMRTVEHAVPPEWRTGVNRRLLSASIVQPFLFDDSTGNPLDNLVCLAVWFVCFTVFSLTMESESASYGSTIARVVPSNRRIILFTTVSCLILIPLLHNNYIYDTTTLACAVLALRALRREKFLELVVLTGIFSFNRETAFIIPGLTFFYWLHKNRPARAFQQAAILSTVYLIIAGSLIYYFRHNPGSLAEDNRAYLIRMYTHQKAPYAIAAIASLVAYSIGVVRSWSLLPPALKAVQWFIPPWIAMHILWGWPMEWRVFFEIYPGMMLTIAAIWTILSKPSRLTPTRASLASVPLEASASIGNNVN